MEIIFPKGFLLQEVTQFLTVKVVMTKFWLASVLQVCLLIYYLYSYKMVFLYQNAWMF